MKNLSLFFLVAVCLFNKAQAQISDVDAKLQYQQAEDFYNQTDYFKASIKSEDLYKKMGKWTPKVLFLYLKAVYNNFIIPYEERADKVSYKKTYSYLNTLSQRCDTLLKQINVASYPPEKYKEIQVMQAYFKNKMEEYAYEKDRTPQDAVNFLNECAKKFRKAIVFKDILGYFDNKGYNTKHPDSVFFQLSGAELIIISNYTEPGKVVTVSNCRIDRIDLSRVTGTDPVSNDNKLILYGQTSYESNGNVQNFWFRAGRREHISGRRTSKKDLELYEKNKKEISDFINMSIENPKTINIRTDNIDLFQFFSTDNDQFRNGNYEERIMDVMRFLIESFPKKKEETAEQSKSKF